MTTKILLIAVFSFLVIVFITVFQTSIVYAGHSCPTTNSYCDGTQTCHDTCDPYGHPCAEECGSCGGPACPTGDGTCELTGPFGACSCSTAGCDGLQYAGGRYSISQNSCTLSQSCNTTPNPDSCNCGAPNHNLVSCTDPSYCTGTLGDGCGYCQNPICNNNGVQDNGESGIDCGGGGCAACPPAPPAGTAGCDSGCGQGVCGYRNASGTCTTDNSCCHRTCNGSSCITIAGGGTNACDNNSQCASTPPPPPTSSTPTCAITYVSGGPLSPVTIRISGSGGTVKGWVRRYDGRADTSITPVVTPFVGSGARWYNVVSCTATSSSSCAIDQQVSFSSLPGEYTFHCDVQDGSPKCSGNPFCDYENGPATQNCNGWQSCSNSDNIQPLSGRITNSFTSNGLDNVIINPNSNPCGAIGQTTTSNGGYFAYLGKGIGAGFCMRPPAIAGYTGPVASSYARTDWGSYECQTSGRRNTAACGLPSRTDYDLANDYTYNFTYTPPSCDTCGTGADACTSTTTCGTNLAGTCNKTSLSTGGSCVRVDNAACTLTKTCAASGYYCSVGNCVRDGAWGPLAYGVGGCSLSCGPGINYRDCNNPAPDGGAECTRIPTANEGGGTLTTPSNRRETRNCNLRDCSSAWIQTTGGDVHSNININAPGGP